MVAVTLSTFDIDTIDGLELEKLYVPSVLSRPSVKSNRENGESPKVLSGIVNVFNMVGAARLTVRMPVVLPWRKLPPATCDAVMVVDPCPTIVTTVPSELIVATLGVEL